MLEFWQNLFSSRGFEPHGHCYLWKPEILWMHVLSDWFIALAYYSIPAALIYFIYKRRDIGYRWVFMMFGCFIVLCGTTHLMDIWTVWHGTYRLEGVIKLLTAVISVATAALLWPTIPTPAYKTPSRLFRCPWCPPYRGKDGILRVAQGCGTITFETEEGQGTTFIMCLPLSPVQVAACY